MEDFKFITMLITGCLLFGLTVGVVKSIERNDNITSGKEFIIGNSSYKCQITNTLKEDK